MFTRGFVLRGMGETDHGMAAVAKIVPQSVAIGFDSSLR